MAVTRDEVRAIAQRRLEDGEKLGHFFVWMSDGRAFHSPFSEALEPEDREAFVRDATEYMNKYGLTLAPKEAYGNS